MSTCTYGMDNLCTFHKHCTSCSRLLCALSMTLLFILSRGLLGMLDENDLGLIELHNTALMILPGHRKRILLASRQMTNTVCICVWVCVFA